MVRKILELIYNGRFTFTSGDSKQSRLRRLRNDVPQRSVLTLYSLIFGSVIFPPRPSDCMLITTTLLNPSGDWKTLKGSISQDMTTFSAYFKIWRLKFSHAKMVAAALQLPNRETKHKVKVYSKSKLLPFCPALTYLGVKLDRSLTFCHHLETLRKKLSTRVKLPMRPPDSEWGAGKKPLRSASLSLVFSTAECCAAVWCCSAHTRLLDSVLNDALSIITGCLRPTPTNHLSILSGIQPVELRRLRATFSLAKRCTLDLDHIFHNQVGGSLDVHKENLKSNAHLCPLRGNLSCVLSKLSIRSNQWTNYNWRTEYSKSTSTLRV